MLLQTGTRGWKLGLLALVLAAVGLVSYWVYRDADARGMDDAPYWGAAVGVAFVAGVIVGGLVAVGVYLSTRPDEYAGSERPFDAFGDDGGDELAGDPAHADLPPVPEITADRVENASETMLRGYARRYDRLDATGDPDQIRAALADLVAAGETEKLGETVEDAESGPAVASGDGLGPAGVDTRRHAGRPQLRCEAGEQAESAESETEEHQEFEWVEG